MLAIAVLGFSLLISLLALARLDIDWAIALGERDDAREEAADLKNQVAAMNLENMELADALKAYEGAWNSLPPPIDEQINDLIRKAGGC